MKLTNLLLPLIFGSTPARAQAEKPSAPVSQHLEDLGKPRIQQ